MSTARIDEIRSEGEAAVSGREHHRRARGAAGPLPSGARPSCPSSCAAWPSWPPEERGQVGGKAAKRGRKALEELIAAEGAGARRRRDRHAPGPRPGRRPRCRRPVAAGRAAAPAHSDLAARSRTSFVGLGFRELEGPRGRDRLLQTSTRSTTRRPTRRARAHRHLLLLDDVLLRTHTSPMQVRVMESQPPPIYDVLPGPCLPARLRRHAHAPVPPARGPGRRRGHHARRPQGHAARVRAGDLRRGARGAPAPRTSSPFTEPSVEVDVSCLQLQGRLPGRRLALPAVQGHRVDRDPRRRMVDPNVFRYVAEYGYDPERIQGWAFGMGFERIAMLKQRRAGPAPVLRQRHQVPEAVRMRAPLEWLAESATRASRSASSPIGSR